MNADPATPMIAYSHRSAGSPTVPGAWRVCALDMPTASQPGAGSRLAACSTGNCGHMETSEALPGGAVSPSDLTDLVSSQGPFLTLVMTTESTLQNAAQRSDKRWRTLRSDLAENRDVPEDVLGDVDPVIADASGVRHVEHGPVPAPVDQAWWEPLPRLGTAIAWRQTEVPFVVALADRTGAMLYGFR